MHILKQKCLYLQFLNYAMFFNSAVSCSFCLFTWTVHPLPKPSYHEREHPFLETQLILITLLYSHTLITPLHLATSIAIICFLKLFLDFSTHQK